MNHQEIRSILKMLDAVERKDCYLKMLSSEMNQYVYENGLINCYKPKTISKLRNLMGISELNLSGNYIFNKKIHSNSGSVFFFSGDFKYVIKTIRESELKTLLKYINSYYLYLENNPSTYLLRIVGCYTLINPSFCTLGCIKTKCTHTHNVLIMKNIFENTKIDKIYDLKGMALARGTNNYIKKDMDWYEDNIKLVITNSELDQLRKDMIFLENQNIMDYSLMVYYPGTRKDSHFELFNMKNRKTYTVSKDLRSSDKPFFIGIVDILTDYDCIKKVEYLWNTFCICKNKSCLNPKDYRERLFNLIEDTSTVEE